MTHDDERRHPGRQRGHSSGRAGAVEGRPIGGRPRIVTAFCRRISDSPVRDIARPVASLLLGARAALLPRLCHHCGRLKDRSEGRATTAMARDIDPFKLSSPRIFLVRMLLFLILAALVVVVLHRQIITAFMSNPGLNALIIAVLVIGILLAFRQVIRLFPEVAWVNGFRLADPGLAVARPPVLLAPMATILGDRAGRMAMSSADDARAARLDRNAPRRGARHLPLHDEPPRLPRPARYLLGPDRDRRLGRQGDRGPESRR